LNGEIIANVQDTSSDNVTEAIVRAKTAFLEWRSIPAPRRGELVQILGDELRSAKVALGRLVTIEAGKILSEGQGEVQEMIDICDFAVGLSRQLYGLTIASERPNHRMMEQWHPLGPVGVITSFNFPVAVWSWNAALALVCGDPVIWKPSEKTPLTALAVQALFERAASRLDGIPAGLSTVLIGGREIGEILVDDPRVPLVSATGSTAMGRTIAPRKQQSRAVTGVIMAAPCRLTRPHRQHRLAAVKRLDLGLLVHTENGGMLWRRDVEANDVPYLGHEIRVGRELESLHAVGLKTEGTPNALNA
jgi:aldehyde dehydrogenase (NAD+)